MALLIVALGFSLYQSQDGLAVLASIMLAIVLAIGVILFLLKRHQRARLLRSGIAEIDQMTGLEFERYLQLLLTRRGYTDISLTSVYDLGTDLLAKKDGIRWAIQAKRYKGAVGLDSVRQVVASKEHYKCDKAMVITNSHFTKNARTIAESTGCVLIDREMLIQAILEASTDTARA